jgi:hypothetical protein
MGYIFATFNKLTYMLIIHVCVYIHIFVFVTKIMGIPWNTWVYPWRRPCSLILSRNGSEYDFNDINYYSPSRVCFDIDSDNLAKNAPELRNYSSDILIGLWLLL